MDDEVHSGYCEPMGPLKSLEYTTCPCPERLETFVSNCASAAKARPRISTIKNLVIVLILFRSQARAGLRGEKKRHQVPLLLSIERLQQALRHERDGGGFHAENIGLLNRNILSRDLAEHDLIMVVVQHHARFGPSVFEFHVVCNVAGVDGGARFNDVLGH